jgi:formamidopyrimidine-DNA glycosylase
MPELPDITLYIEHLERRILGARLLDVRVSSLNLLRTADPPIEDARGRTVELIRRIGKRIVIELSGGRAIVLHLMIAGRLHWKDGELAADSGLKGTAAGRAATPHTRRGRNDLAEFVFSTGVLRLTEAGTKQRVSLHYLADPADVDALDPGGLEPLRATRAEFAAAIRRENHTLKRALTDPHLLSGIGNAYSDEILHRARLSPLLLTSRLDAEQMDRLYDAVRTTLDEWTERLRVETGDSFPEKVTAFREGMAVHGKYREPCPVCGAPIQRIRYADNETNYCARCQTDGRLLADRAMSRLLRNDWPKTLEELEGG